MDIAHRVLPGCYILEPSIYFVWEQIREYFDKKIKAIDKVRKEQRKQVLDSDPDSYVSLFLGGSNEESVFESVAKRQEILLYLLVLFEECIQGR